MEKNIALSDINLNKTKGIALTALLFAVSLILASVENTMPSIAGMAPGVKLGLSNIAVMYALFFLGNKKAFSIALLKSFFIIIFKGGAAGFLSLFGGIISVAAMSLLLLLFKNKISYLTVSIFGAVFHNAGQFAAVCLLYSNLYMLAYLPVLLISGVIAGTSTATLLKWVLPALEKLQIK